MSWISERIVQLQSAVANFLPTETNGVHEVVEPKFDFNTLKVPELKAMAKDRGLKGYTGLRKAQLVDLLDQN